ncbi:MarR family winged helix-turn-helix transcriptional regulator [Marinivivus vitaminiproducens]|uniref:MarR family winged helix-turn-helix transcriptional regulator n=1 Tax=Marinivivus vitaminiproducens TaxID=3035935 RepID=UPI0027A51BDC|nr:MarR family transcriptional regulator [Geminicoccaceae bacterium SCSIO 64248]
MSARDNDTAVQHLARPRSRARTWSLAQRPGFLIRRLHQIHVALFNRHCAAFGMTPLQYSLLDALAQRGEADQTTLADDVSLDLTTTAGALRRMEARDLIRRTVHTGDRRARLCVCTEVGMSLLEAMEAPVRVAHDATLATLDRTERKQFISLLQRMIADATT